MRRCSCRRYQKEYHSPHADLESYPTVALVKGIARLSVGPGGSSCQAILRLERKKKKDSTIVISSAIQVLGNIMTI